MGKNQGYESCPDIVLTNHQILKVSMILFFVSLTFNIIDLSYQNPVEGQTTMYKMYSRYGHKCVNGKLSN